MNPKIGDSFAHEFSFCKEQAMQYAIISGDTNPIHINDEYGRKSMFGECIIHGYFSISVFSKVYGTLLYPEGHILISQQNKYIKPLFTSNEYIAIFTVVELYPEKNRVKYKNEIFEKATDELKISGEAILMNKLSYVW